MGKWKTKRLGDICDILSGGTPSRSKSEYWNNGNIPWVKISDFNGKYLESTEEKITKNGLENSSAKLFEAGTILFTIFATLGEVTILKIDATTNQAIAGIIIKDNTVNKYYLYYYLLSLKSFVNSVGRGVAQNNINMSILRDFRIPIPPLEEQQKIAATLDKVTDLISLCKKELEELDLLVKARFSEMFGDLATNNKGFEQHKGADLFKFSSGKFLKEEKRFESGFAAYGGNGIAWYTDEPLIDYPTIIIGRVGALCGNIHMVKEPVWITDNAIYIKEHKTDKFTLEFLNEVMKMMNFYQYADFSGQPKITQKPLENLLYIVPPKHMQNEFSDFVQATDKSKNSVKKSLEKLETLKKSLMQEYFG
ncbi:MAG: restriction endonuclease subunit S [Oscillospiraceae bacterium]|nr:restriction endonuclease subunit S [Oscillospiraceae bacterium]